MNEGGDFVLLGDIFDFWRKDSVEILNTYEDIIEKLIGFPNNVEVHYVIGSHDYCISEMPEYFDQNPLITRIPDLYLRNNIQGTLYCDEIAAKRARRPAGLDVIGWPPWT